MANVKAKAVQLSPGVSTANDFDYLRMTKLGALYTADWWTQLVLAGKAYSAHIGTLSAGADVGFIVGGGNGTTVDSDQPEMIISVGTGYYLIPKRITVICDVDIDANDEYGEIVVFADRTQNYTTATGTPGAITPNNLLDGAAAFPGYCAGGITTDITDPVMSEFIDMEYVNAAEFVSNGTATNLTNGIVYKLKLDRNFEGPRYLAGPATIVICFGGTAAVNGMINAEFACIPSEWVPAT